MSFANIYIIFFIIATINRYRILFATRARKKIPGTITEIWTYAAMFINYHIMAYGAFIEFLLVPKIINYWISILGLLLYLFGITARVWAINTLDKYWSVNIEIREKQPLIKKGPYRFLRHPNYLYHLLEVIGFPLISNSFYILIFVFLISIPTILIRLYLEEIELIKKLGQEYLNYRDEVWALFPFPIMKKGVRDFIQRV